MRKITNHLLLITVILSIFVFSCSENKEKAIEKSPLEVNEIGNLNKDIQTPKPNKTAVLNDNNVRLRENPSLKSNIIMQLNKDEAVQVLMKSSEKQNIEEMLAFWYKIKTESGSIGWMYGEFLDLSFDDANLPVQELEITSESKSSELAYTFFDKNVISDQEIETTNIITSFHGEIITSPYGIILRNNPNLYLDMNMAKVSNAKISEHEIVQILEEQDWKLIDNEIVKIFKISYNENIYFTTSNYIALYFKNYNTLLVKDCFYKVDDSYAKNTLFIIEYQKIGVLNKEQIYWVDSFYANENVGFGSTTYKDIKYDDINNDSIDELCTEYYQFGGYYFSDGYQYNQEEYLNQNDGSKILSYTKDGGGLAVNDQIEKGFIEKLDKDKDGEFEIVLYRYTINTMDNIMNEEIGNIASTLYKWNGDNYENIIETPYATISYVESISVFEEDNESSNIIRIIKKSENFSVEYFEILNDEIWAFISNDDEEKGWIQGKMLELGY